MGLLLQWCKKKTRGRQNGLPAPRLKNMLYKVTSRYTAKIDLLYKNVGSTDWDKVWKFCNYIPHTHMICMLGPTPLDGAGAAWDHGFEMCECTSYYEGRCSQLWKHIPDYFNFGCRPGNKWESWILAPLPTDLERKSTDDVWAEKKTQSPRTPRCM